MYCADLWTKQIPCLNCKGAKLDSLEFTFAAPELIAATQDIQHGLEGVHILVQGMSSTPPPDMRLWDPMFGASSDDPVPRSVRSGINWDSTASYIYTSGTTGQFCDMQFKALVH